MKKVIDRVVQFPNRYRLVKVADEEDVYDLEPVEGEVIEEGSPIGAYLFDSIAEDVNKLAGRAATIAVDPNITKLSPNSSPRVDNIGTGQDARLKFSLPDGVHVKQAQVSYGDGVDGKNPPDNFTDGEVIQVAQGRYLWTRYIIDFTDGTQSRIYTAAYQGVDGKNGTSVTVSSTTTQYQSSASGTTIPETWQNTVPTVAQGNYLWTKVTTTFSDGKTAISYTASRQGKDGKSIDGVSIDSGTAVSGGTEYTLDFTSSGNSVGKTKLVAPQGIKGNDGKDGLYFDSEKYDREFIASIETFPLEYFNRTPVVGEKFLIFPPKRDIDIQIGYAKIDSVSFDNCTCTVDWKSLTPFLYSLTIHTKNFDNEMNGKLESNCMYIKISWQSVLPYININVDTLPPMTLMANFGFVAIPESGVVTNTKLYSADQIRAVTLNSSRRELHVSVWKADSNRVGTAITHKNVTYSYDDLQFSFSNIYL